MGRINPLVTDFLHKHPADCARVLEQLPSPTSCSLIRAIQPQAAAGIVECMVTSYGSQCLRLLDTHTAVAVIREVKTPHAARLLRALGIGDSKMIFDELPAYLKSNIHSSLKYPDGTVGRVMDSNPFSLPESVSVNDAVRRVKALRERSLDEIFVVDNDHKLTGVIHVASLLSASRSSSLQTVVVRDVPRLSTRTSLHAAAVHTGWKAYGTLPVVGEEDILSGVLKSSTLMHVLAESLDTRESPDALDEFLSMTKMYWIVMTELVNAFARDRGDTRGQRD